MSDLAPYKLLWVSDSPTLVTGYSNQTRGICERLCRHKWLDVNVLGAQYYGYPVYFNQYPARMYYTKPTEDCYRLWGSGQKAYCEDVLQDYLKRLVVPDLLITLLDSLTEDRHIPILIDNKIKIVSFKELWALFEINKNIKTLALKVKVREGIGLLNNKHWKKTVTYAEWSDLTDLARRYVEDYDIHYVRQRFGETKVTSKHSLLYINNNKLKSITPKKFIEANHRFVTPDILPQMKELNRQIVRYKIDLLDWVKKEKYLIENDTIKIKRGRAFPRFITKDKLKHFLRIIGAYISEGCLNTYNRGNSANYSIIISNNNKNWLESLRKDYNELGIQKASYSNNGTNMVTYNKTFYNILLDLCGKGANNKKLPDFAFYLECKQLQVILDEMIFGDGHLYKTTGYYRYYRKQPKNRLKHVKFCYSTNSQKLIGQLSLIFRKNNIKFSIVKHTKKNNWNILSSAFISRVKTHCTVEKYTGYIYDITVEEGNFVDACGLVGVKNTFMAYPWINQDIGPAKWLFYFPSDGYPMPTGAERVFRKTQYQVAMAPHGQKQLFDMGFKDCKLIPHGVDPNTFHRLSEYDRSNIRKQWGIPENTFLVESIFRNQGRKMPGEMLKAWKKFSDGKRDVMLLMHADPQDVASPVNMNELIHRYNIQDSVRWTGMASNRGFSPKQVNELYNMADVHTLSTSGEGFGIPIVESSICGVPNILPDYTTSSWLTDGGKCGYLAKLSATLTGQYEVERGIVDVNSLADGYETYYRDRSLLKDHSKKAEKYVLNNFTWEKIYPAWIQLIKSISEE